MDTTGYTTENLPYVRLYVENQGDKFHPLSDTLASVFDAADQQAQDDLTSYVPAADEAQAIADEQDQALLENILTAINDYEQDESNARRHQYHIDALREKMVPWED